MPMSTNANVSAMQEVQKKRSEQKLQTLQIVLEDLLANGESITMKRVTEISGLSRQYIYSNKEANVLFNNAKIKSESISPIPKNDLIMQHEELRRKLQDSYILQHQLLSAENERLRQEISEIEAKLAIARSEHDKKIAYQKASPKFKLHVVPVDMPEDELITYQLKTSTGKILNPVGEKIINNLIWGEHIFSSPKYLFELADHVDGISIESKDDTCLLIISDKIKSAQTIKILIREREA